MHSPSVVTRALCFVLVLYLLTTLGGCTKSPSGGEDTPKTPSVSPTRATANESQSLSGGEDEYQTGDSYFPRLRDFFSKLYLNFALPLAILATIVFLGAYLAGRIFEADIDKFQSFSRAIATTLPFLLSLYVVLISETRSISNLVNLPWGLFLLLGSLIGFLFIFWIIRLSSDLELQIRLSCFAASLILFTILTAFVVFNSVEMLSAVFGFLFGVSTYVLVFGLTDSPIPRLRSFRK